MELAAVSVGLSAVVVWCLFELVGGPQMVSSRNGLASETVHMSWADWMGWIDEELGFL